MEDKSPGPSISEAVELALQAKKVWKEPAPRHNWTSRFEGLKENSTSNLFGAVRDLGLGAVIIILSARLKMGRCGRLIS